MRPAMIRKARPSPLRSLELFDMIYLFKCSRYPASRRITSFDKRRLERLTYVTKLARYIYSGRPTVRLNGKVIPSERDR